MIDAPAAFRHGLNQAVPAQDRQMLHHGGAGDGQPLR